MRTHYVIFDAEKAKWQARRQCAGIIGPYTRFDAFKLARQWNRAESAGIAIRPKATDAATLLTLDREHVSA